MQPLDCSKLAKNPKNDNDVTILRHDVIVKLFWHCFVSLVKFSYWSKFHVNIVTGSRIMSISLIRDWPEIGKSEIPPSEFCPISGDWGQFWIPYLAQMSLIKSYWMLQNSRVTARPPFPPRLGLIKRKIRKRWLFKTWLIMCYLR